MANDRLENWFTYHPPKGDQVQRYESIRNEAHLFADFLLWRTPAGPEQEAALQHLRQVVFWANAAIACGE